MDILKLKAAIVEVCARKLDGAEKLELATYVSRLSRAVSIEPEVHRIVMYRDGFTVDHGPLRKPGIPENDQFLTAISKGLCPPELINGKTGEPGRVSIVDYREDTYAKEEEEAEDE